METLQSFSKHKMHKDLDSMVLCVMSHGFLHPETFVMSDGQTVTSKKEYEIVNETNCPAMKGKPTILIFEHCIGTFHLINMDPKSKPSMKIKRQPRDKKISETFLSYSSCYGEACYLHKWTILMKLVEEGMCIYQNCENRIPEEQKSNFFYFNPKPIEYKYDNDDSNGNDSNDNDSNSNDNHNDTDISDDDIDDDNDDIDDNDDNANDDNDNTDSDKITNLNSSARKLVLLINNLDGCESDMDKLKNIFILLGYNVIGPVINVTYEKLKEVIKKFKEDNHWESTFIVFYGDGFDNYIVTYDHYAIHLNELMREFNDTYCPNLINKPKIFIINVCYFDGEVTFECINEVESNMDHQQIPADRDMFMLHVEMEGSHCENGSLLTAALCQVLMELIEKSSPKQLLWIMGSVSERLYELQEGSSEEHICEQRIIRFPHEFSISPIKAQNEQQGSHQHHSISESSESDHTGGTTTEDESIGHNQTGASGSCSCK